MKYLSVDIETTGLRSSHNMIQFAAVLEDTTKNVPIERLPSFVAYFREKELTMSQKAFTMNMDLLTTLYRDGSSDRIIEDLDKKLKEDGHKNFVCELIEDNDERVNSTVFGFDNRFRTWLSTFDGIAERKTTFYGPRYESIIVAGKGFNSFDRKFVEKKLHTLKIPRHYIDPTPFSIDFKSEENADTNNLSLEDLVRIRERELGEKYPFPLHDALGDAKAVIWLLRDVYR